MNDRLEHSLLDCERGSMLLITLTLALAVVFLTPLVIDVTRANYIGDGIQRAADASSLSGATELVLSTDTDAEKWTRAKRSIIGVLRQNPIFMSTSFPVIGSTTGQGIKDPCEKTGSVYNDYAYQTYDNGRLRIEISRGNYDNGTDSFTSMENVDASAGAVCDTSLKPNAVRVTVTFFNFANLFGKVPPFTFVSIPTISRTGIGAFVN